MECTQGLFTSSRSSSESVPSAPTSTPALQSFVFTSSRCSPSNQRPSDLSYGHRSRHAQGAIDIKTTIPFPIGTNGFVPLPITPRSPRSPPPHASTPSQKSDSSVSSAMDYFSPRQPSSAAMSSAYQWLATPGGECSSSSAVSTPSTTSSASSYPVPTASFFPHEIDLTLAELFAVARKVRKQKQKMRSGSVSNAAIEDAPQEGNGTLIAAGQRRQSHSEGSDWSDANNPACDRRLRLFADPQNEHGYRHSMDNKQ